MVLYFTATGNCLYVAEQIDSNVFSIPKMVKKNKYHFTDEKIGLVFPVYSLSVPPYITNFIEKATFSCDYLFAVMTFGKYDGAASSHLQNVAAKSGKTFSYITTLKMVDNWLPKFEMADQIKSAYEKQIETNLEQIVSDIQQAKHFIRKDSIQDKLFTKQLLNTKLPKGKREQAGRHIIGEKVSQFFEVEDNCTYCGVCTKVCPVDNITVESTKPVFQNYCISCLSCTHNCPQNAIRLKGELSKVRYRNEHVPLKEIIAANI